jgi:hypothetical protein
VRARTPPSSDRWVNLPRFIVTIPSIEQRAGEDTEAAIIGIDIR